MPEMGVGRCHASHHPLPHGVACGCARAATLLRAWRRSRLSTKLSTPLAVGDAVAWGRGAGTVGARSAGGFPVPETECADDGVSVWWGESILDSQCSPAPGVSAPLLRNTEKRVF